MNKRGRERRSFGKSQLDSSVPTVSPDGGQPPLGHTCQCAPCTPALRELKRTESGSDATAVTDATKCCCVQLFQKTHSFWVSQRECLRNDITLDVSKKKKK